MTLKEWLPITKRNRVALVLAAFSLIVFVTWNCIPVPDYIDGPVDRIFAVEFWPGILSFYFYVYLFKSPDPWNLMAVAARFAIYITTVMSLLTVPFWRLFHASPVLRMLIAIACLLGGLVVIFGMLSGKFGYGSLSKNVALALISVNMFSVSAALFTFKNELALRSERAISRAGGSQ
jgi:hypothetical protein